MPQSSQNTKFQTALKHYNQFKILRAAALRWVKIATDTGQKFKVEIIVKERDQQLFNFITIDVLNI